MKYYVELGENEFGFEVHNSHEGTVVSAIEPEDAQNPSKIDFVPVYSRIETGEGLYSLIADGKSYELYVEPKEHGFKIVLHSRRFDIDVLTEREWRLKKVAPRQSLHSGELNITAPMPGLVKGVLVESGDTVKKGQRLIVLEAMKMENDITAPADGKVGKLHVQPGTVVEGGKSLLTIEA